METNGSTGVDGDNILETNGSTTGVDVDSIFSSFQKTLQRFQMKNKITLNKVEGFCTSIDENLAVLMEKLEQKREELTVFIQEVKSLRGSIEDLEACKLEQEEEIANLKDERSCLLSACANATRDLELGLEKNLLHFLSAPEINASGRLKAADAEDQKMMVCSNYVKPVDGLLSTAKKVQALFEQFEKETNAAGTRIHNLENELEKVRVSSEKVTKERDSYRSEISKLEMEVEALQISCSTLELKAEDRIADYEMLKAREAEISAMYSDLLQKQTGDQIKIILL